MFLKETYKNIEDCIGFNTMTSLNDMSLLNIPSGVPIQYSNDGANLNYTKSDAGYTFNLKDPYTEPVSIEFELRNNGTDDTGLGYVPIMNFRNSHSDNSALAIQGISPKTKLKLSGSDSVYTDITVSSVIGVYKILLTSDTEYSVYLNDVFIHTITNASISTKGMSIFIGRLRSATIRNFKIKPL